MASVALLRGINVGGRRKVSMPALAAAFTAAGCTDVVTYIQSGNVVFTPPSGFGPPEPRLAEVIEALTGFDVPVVVRTGAQLATILEALPFPDAEDSHLHVCFLGAPPSAAALARFGEAATPPEAFAQPETNQPETNQTDICLYLPAGMGRSKLGLAVDRLGVPVTVRGWRTVTKLAALAQAQ